MLCPGCRRHVRRQAESCPRCGRPLGPAARGYELALEDGTRIPVRGTVTVGRAPGNTVQLTDRTVSRRHARITQADGAITVEDAGSSHGTWVDGRRVAAAVTVGDGARVRVGDRELVVERVRADEEAGRTVVVPAGATIAPDDSSGGPRLRSGYALKRLEASEGPRRWVLRDLRSGRFLRLADDDGWLIELLDGRRTMLELMGEAERRVGPEGPPRLARLLAELADRGLLSGADAAPTAGPLPTGRVRGLLAPREWAWAAAGAHLDRLYARGGRSLFTPAGLVVLGLVALAGLMSFAYLVLGRYGTPFVVASKVGLGGLVFMVGRLAVAAVHETAHGLAMAAFGRRVGRAGLKLVLIFPYAFVDTSEAWLEPRRRRIAVSAAGPVSDGVLAGAFSLCCLMLGPGAPRDVCFQLAFGAYLGGLFNLNPFVERDGYHMLADALGEPNLRRRGREELSRRIRGEASAPVSGVVLRYAVAGLAWSIVAAGMAIVVSLRYAPVLHAVLPTPIVATLLASLWGALLTPVLVAVGGPLRGRLRARGGDA